MLTTTSPTAPTAPTASVRAGTAQGGIDALALRSRAGLQATFAPQVGMTCCSLADGDRELLGERFGLAAYASCGLTMGLSLMHPWADRLPAWRYEAGGASVRLPVSPLLHTDRWGLPVNGVQSCGGAWSVEEAGAHGPSAWLDARLPFEDPRRLALFPFPHELRLHAEVRGRTLTIASELRATGATPVPVCFGYRLYLARPGEATLTLPAREQLATDARLLPTGPRASRELQARALAHEDHEELCALGDDRAIALAAAVARGGHGDERDPRARRVTLSADGGFPFAQVRSRRDEPHVMLEALTAAPGALARGGHLLATRERPYRAELRLTVEGARR